MIKDKTSDEYFNWLCNFVYEERYNNVPFYTDLLAYLHDVRFTYIDEMDGDREEDGIRLRHRFMEENNIPFLSGFEDSFSRGCSVLEMMVALVVRCEENIMGDDSLGDRTSLWFWSMVESLGFRNIRYNEVFNVRYVSNIIKRFLNRDYSPYGDGGLFKIENADVDLREINIWYQMCRYLDEYYHP